MTHQEIINKTKAEIDSLCAQAKEKLDAITPIEAEVGKWYKDPSSDYLVYVTKILGKHNYVEVYGFGSDGNWFNKWDTVVHQLCVEATPQVVEKALIEEAKRRGHTYSEYDYNPEENELCGIDDGRLESVFCDGHWEQPVDKFAELKEAHRNGAVIESMPKKWIGDWTIATNPIWDGDNYEYRIKPEEKPKVGDVCKFWNEYEDVFLVGIYAELRDRNDQWDDNSTHVHGVRLGEAYSTKFFKHAKTLTKQEAIELLFNNK